VKPKKLIDDLIASGWTQERIAERVEVGQAAISKLQTEQRKEMRSSNWERLVALHNEVCGESAAA
jgi:transcriptional regulator with XRE-family HTH domain